MDHRSCPVRWDGGPLIELEHTWKSERDLQVWGWPRLWNYGDSMYGRAFAQILDSEAERMTTVTV